MGKTAAIPPGSHFEARVSNLFLFSINLLESQSRVKAVKERWKLVLTRLGTIGIDS